MAYADYDYYVKTYGGSSVSSTDWPAASRDASAFLDILTYGRLKGHPERVSDEVKMAVCAAAEASARYTAAASSHAAGVASESVGSQSVSYLNGEETGKAKQQEMLAAAGLFLPRSHPLRYAGAL